MANKQFGNTLRKLRNNKGYTQQQAANALKLKNKSTLGSWEVGKSEPDGYTLLRLCKLYDVTDIYTAFEDTAYSEGNININNFDFKVPEIELINKYRSIDTYGKKAVDAVLDAEYERFLIEENKKILESDPVLKFIYEDMESEDYEEIREKAIEEYQLNFAAESGTKSKKASKIANLILKMLEEDNDEESE